MVRHGIVLLVLLVASLVAGGLDKTEAAGGADLQVSVTPPASALVGQLQTFQYRLFNAGPDTATNVTLTLSLPPGASIGFYDPGYPACTAASITSRMVCTYASIGAGETRTARLDLYLNTLGANSSTASVTSDTPDPNTSNDTASGTVDVQGVTADAAVFLSGPVGDLVVGDVPDYHLTLGNFGPDQTYLPSRSSSHFRRSSPLPAVCHLLTGTKPRARWGAPVRSPAQTYSQAAHTPGAQQTRSRAPSPIP